MAILRNKLCEMDADETHLTVNNGREQVNYQKVLCLTVTHNYEQLSNILNYLFGGRGKVRKRAQFIFFFYIYIKKIFFFKLDYLPLFNNHNL